MVIMDFNETFALMAIHHCQMHFCIRFDHRLENPPNGCKNGIFEWNVEGGDLYGSTKRL